MNIKEEAGYVFYTVTPDCKSQYEQLIGNLDSASYLKNIEEASSDLMDVLPFILKIVDQKTDRLMVPRLELDTYIAEMFFLYAIEGIPRFVMRNEGGLLREQNQEELKEVDFGLDLSTFIAYNELFTALEESFSAGHPAISMILVLNLFAARIKLDAAVYVGSEENHLTIAEIALLAGMKEKSVRNLATKEMSATYDVNTERTVVSTSNLVAWLKGRRKYVPSLELESDAARHELIKIASEFF